MSHQNKSINLFEVREREREGGSVPLPLYSACLLLTTTCQTEQERDVNELYNKRRRQWPMCVVQYKLLRTQKEREHHHLPSSTTNMCDDDDDDDEPPFFLLLVIFFFFFSIFFLPALLSTRWNNVGNKPYNTPWKLIGDKPPTLRPRERGEDRRPTWPTSGVIPPPFCLSIKLRCSASTNTILPPLLLPYVKRTAYIYMYIQIML